MFYNLIMKTKDKQVKVPKYNLKEQLNYITDVCKQFDFDGDTLVSLIFSDWIYLIQSGCIYKNMSLNECFLSYLLHSEKLYKDFLKLKECSDDLSKR